MSLTAAQQRHFSEHGYVAVPDLFSVREVSALQTEVERFKREGLFHNVATDGDGQTPSTKQANFQLIPLYDKSDLIRAQPVHIALVDVEIPLHRHGGGAPRLDRAGARSAA